MSHSIGCVILASGLGRRFQVPDTPWRNKLLAPFRGRPLIAAILDLTAAVPCGPRTLVTRDPQLADWGCAQGVDCVLHTLPHRSDSIRLGLERLLARSGGTLSGCLFCPGDQPLLERESLLALLEAFRSHPERICRLVSRRGPGMPALFPAWSFPALLHLPEGAGGGWLMRRCPEQVMPVPVRSALELEDADTPEALARLEASAALCGLPRSEHFGNPKQAASGHGPSRCPNRKMPPSVGSALEGGEACTGAGQNDIGDAKISS